MSISNIDPSTPITNSQTGVRPSQERTSDKMTESRDIPAVDTRNSEQNPRVQAVSTDEAQAKSSTSDDEAAYQAIVRKVNGGMQLTNAELSTLRSKSPSLYAKAMKASAARNALHEQMEMDTTHAAKAFDTAMSELDKTYGAGPQTPAAEGEMSEKDVVANALDNEYRQFIAAHDQVEMNMNWQ